MQGKCSVTLLAWFIHLAAFTEVFVSEQCVNMQTYWIQDFRYCQVQFENKQQLTVSLFCLYIFKAPGCLLWIQIWMTIQSNANHQFICLLYFLDNIIQGYGERSLFIFASQAIQKPHQGNKSHFLVFALILHGLKFIL